MLTELAIIIFRLGYAVAVADEDLSPVKLHRTLLVAAVVEQADHSSAPVQLAQIVPFAKNNRAQMAAIAIGEPALLPVIHSQKQGRVFLRGSALEKLMIEQGK